MRILYVSDVYFPRINGVSTSIQSFRGELERRSHRVQLVVPRYGSEPAQPDVHRVPSLSVPFDPEDRRMRPERALALLSRLREEPPDLVHVQTPFVAQKVGLGMARALGVPLVATVHTHFEEYLHHYVPLMPRPISRRLARALSRRQARQADALVVPSPPIRELLESYRLRSRIHVIPTGLPHADLEGGDGRAFRRRFRIPEGRPTLVHVGRLAHEKNVRFLLEVTSNVRQLAPNILLILAGEGPALPDLHAHTYRLGLQDNVLFVGYLDRRKTLKDCYRAGDVFVFASPTETQGLVLLEAMALGVPVVSTSHLGTRDIVEPQRGALLAEANVEHFSSQVTRLISSRDLRQRMGREGASFVREAWTIERTAEPLVDLYASLGPRRRAAA